MSDSLQHKLDRVRPPRVQITYDVEIGDAVQNKELPLIVGILADAAGKPEKPLPKLKDRSFVEIDNDNFDDVLASLAPRLPLQVENRLAGDGSRMNVELRFSKLEDFDPVSIIKQVEPLRRLYDARERLNDLLAKLEGNDELNALLVSVMESSDQQSALRGALEGPQAAVAAPAATPADDE
ncbi:type VI secretion protein [Azospirillum thiophilum]|uniref:Type VI secretion protein n=1 Tax=Azospirillum thiophilum TaxID=528244 RepID=A0AAC8W0D1_9PROT|nr:type VI secretion system contractile sheath small subunit [Azospirillum thiophilum]ALG72575.1 type VI secretion protein [Azospirillum thiophilum]KJR64507.1 type VI secretion protein [Azospirillum thiophilum]